MAMSKARVQLQMFTQFVQLLRMTQRIPEHELYQLSQVLYRNWNSV